MVRKKRVAKKKPEDEPLHTGGPSVEPELIKGDTIVELPTSPEVEDCPEGYGWDAVARKCVEINPVKTALKFIVADLEADPLVPLIPTMWDYGHKIIPRYEKLMAQLKRLAGDD